MRAESSMRPKGVVQEKEMTAIVHYLRTWRRVAICGQDGVCGDELLPDPEETHAKTGTMASKTNLPSWIDMVLE